MTAPPPPTRGKSPGLEAIVRHAARLDADPGEDPRSTWGARPGVRTASLATWLMAARAADIPAIDAAEVVTVRIDDLLAFDTDDPAVHARLVFAEFWARPGHRAWTMLRWDFCAPLELKMRLAAVNADWTAALT